MLNERSYTKRPDRMLMNMDESTDLGMHQDLANLAVEISKRNMPKITGALAGTIRPAFGATYWGIYFPDKRVWYLETGTNPFTMNNLAGKVIPMWVDDANGEEAKKIGRKAKTRITIDGRKQTLIFRRAARKGQRKTVMRNGVMKSVPMSYPGAPGRISNRGGGGRIGSPNGGVRWRHPGIDSRHYLNNSMEETCIEFGLQPDTLLLVDAATFSTATKA